MALKFNGKTPKKIVFNGLNIAKVICNDVVVWLQKVLKSITGHPLTLIDSTGEDLEDYKVYGNSVQDGVPTPYIPVEVESVGEYDTASGKYRISIKVSNGTNENITNVYLDEPLRKLGDYADYIDFKNQKVIRNVGKKRFTGNEDFSTTLMTNALVYRIGNKIIKNALCTHFVYALPLPIANKRYWGSFAISSLSESGIGFLQVNSPYTKEEFIQYILEQYNNGTPIEVYYQYQTAVEEKISLPIISTYEDTCTFEIISNVETSMVGINYYSKR